MRWRNPLTRRGIALLIGGAVVIATANLLAAPLLLYIGVFLVLLPVLALVLVLLPRRRGTVIRRFSADLLPVGGESAVVLRVTGGTLLPAPTRWHDELPIAVQGEAYGVLRAGDELRYTVTGVRRGRWPIGPLQLRTEDPFGLAQHMRRIGETSEILVAPRVESLLPLGTRSGSGGSAALSTSNRLGQGADNLSPRAYVTGDSMRRIHWRATARRGDLMVRQEEDESNPHALVILDNAAHHWDRAGDEGDPAFETAVSACASLAFSLAAEGFPVRVLDADGGELGTVSGGEDERESLLIALAEVALAEGRHPLAAIVGEATPGPLIVITGHIPEEDARLFHPGSAGTPILLLAAADTQSIETAVSRGWSGAALDEDIADSWADAVTRTRSSRVAR